MIILVVNVASNLNEALVAQVRPAVSVKRASVSEKSLGELGTFCAIKPKIALDMLKEKSLEDRMNTFARSRVSGDLFLARL